MIAVALRFLGAYWKADLRQALAECTSTAIIVLPSSAPLPSPAPIGEVLPLIFERIYPRFVGGRFSTSVERCLADESVAFVEYRARGDLTNGRDFDCGYLAVFEFSGGLICKYRPYTDTKYVEIELLAC
jgi:ketosteroid isomerase-like protein